MDLCAEDARTSSAGAGGTSHVDNMFRVLIQRIPSVFAREGKQVIFFLEMLLKSVTGQNCRTVPYGLSFFQVHARECRKKRTFKQTRFLTHRNILKAKLSTISPQTHKSVIKIHILYKNK